MTSHDHTSSLVGKPAAPPRWPGPLPLLTYIRLARENVIAAWPEEAFEAEFMARKMLFRRVFVANSPEAAKHVLQSNADNYAKSVISRRLLVPGLGQGLLTSEGAFWRRQRRIVAPAFQHKRILAFGDAMTSATLDLLGRWDGLDDGATLDVAEEMMRLTLEIISRTMFSSDIGDEFDALGEAITRYQESAGRVRVADLLGLPGWLPRVPSRKARGAIAQLDRTITGIIARRRASGEDKGDLLSMLLLARDQESGEGMSEGQVRDEVATILTAGHETTANALAWTWYLLSGHPEAEARLHEELERTFAGHPPGSGDIAELSYTRMVIEESMRLYPPAHTMSRRALGDDEICGHAIPAGSTVIVSPWLLHRHKALWDDPDDFKPERFSPERSAARPKFAYIPFGGGARVCIGATFAMTEAMLILATVAQRYRLRLEPGHPVEPVGLITLRPRFGLSMRLERRA